LSPELLLVSGRLPGGRAAPARLNQPAVEAALLRLLRD